MGLFGKSMEDQVNKALEKLRGQFPQARLAASVDDKTVTLRGEAPDMQTKSAIMEAFNSQVKTDNTINQITVSQSPAAGGSSGTSQPGAGTSPGMSPSAATGGTGRTHEVAKGDTLSAIAQRYYGNASQYQKIFDANRDQLSDPDRIQPGQRLKIPD